MKSKPIVPSLILLALFVFFSEILFSQTDSNAQLQTSMIGAKMRAPLDVQPGQTLVSLCGLIPGNEYTVIANGRTREQKTSFEIKSAGRNVQPSQKLDRPNILRFTASSECADLLVTATEAGNVTSVPMYLSVKCETCPEVNAWKKNLLNATGAAALEVSPGGSASDLISEVLIDGECFDVENVTFNGNGSQIGTFSNGSSNIGFESGLIIATGASTVAVGPNSQDNASAGFGVLSFDADLSELSDNLILFDRANIEFDFTPTATPVTFQFVFASEEYCEYVGSQFNDVFGFFISGPGISGPFSGGAANIALVGPGEYVTINNVNHIQNSSLYVNNQPSSSGNLCAQQPSVSPAINEVQFDGFTQQLTAVANVVPCQTYRIKLKIADVSDGIFDSAVFLKGGSFDGGASASVDFVLNGNPASEEAIEGCGDLALVVDRVGSDLSQPVTVNFSVGGTATPGTDYSPLDSTYIIPAGEDQLIVPISVFTDSLSEGSETIVLTLDNSCSCDATQKTLNILDYSAMLDTTVTVSICNSGTGATLTANPLGGIAPYTYEWSTTETTESIFVNPTDTATYTVSIVDACGDTAVNYFIVNVSPLVEFTDSLRFCPGGSVTIGDSTYFEPTVVTDTILGQNGACDTVATYVLELLPLNSFTDTIAFCPGGSVTIGDSTYTVPTTVVETLEGQNGACDTVATYVLELLPLNSFTDTIAFCSGGSVTIGDSTYTVPTTVVETLEGQNGACDTIATYVLELSPQITFTESVSFCPGSSVTIGDSTYTQSATVVETLEGQNGTCDTIATYILTLLPQITFTESVSFCPGSSVTIGDSTYTQSATVVETLEGQNGACDTIATYVLTLLSQVSFTDTITFCPGDSVVVNGNIYTEAGIYLDTLPGAGSACDTLATYVLVSLTPAPSTVEIVCPDDVTVTAEPAVLDYDLPEASTDCPCPGLSLELTEGLAPGSTFPAGVTKVCYEAKDSCGNTASCCFEVTVPNEEPCSESTTGCIKYELLSITKDAAGNKTYRIRVTNNCTNKLMYAAFGLPSGVTALAPPNNSVYVAPSGREYSVRNPNFTPFYSIRFKSDMAGIASGASDIFEYTLPALANPAAIHTIVRVEPKIFYENYLFTGDCPVDLVSKPAVEQPNLTDFGKSKIAGENGFIVFPNPTSGLLFADLSDWADEQIQVQIFDSRGQRVQFLTLTADAAPRKIQLPEGLANGLYFFEILRANGEKQALRFVLQR